MPGDLVELQRCRDSLSVTDVTRILDAAGISYRLGSDAPVVDISSIGTGNDAQVIISVRAADYDTARAVMEEDSLRIPLPDNHYLLTSTDDELAEIVGHPDEWSTFDVAHARRLMTERGVDLSRIAARQEERVSQLKEGKEAPTSLLVIGWISTLLGGWIGIGIAWALGYSKETTPEGEFPTYNVAARTQGKMMFPIACVNCAVTLACWIYYRSMR